MHIVQIMHNECSARCILQLYSYELYSVHKIFCTVHNYIIIHWVLGTVQKHISALCPVPQNIFAPSQYQLWCILQTSIPLIAVMLRYHHSHHHHLLLFRLHGGVLLLKPPHLLLVDLGGSHDDEDAGHHAGHVGREES